jgi:post-segregation antitoxin (ccd killing protein)
MQRTQIYLSKELHQALHQRARRRGVTISHLIRENLEQEYHQKKTGRSKEVLRSLAKLGERRSWQKTPKDLSRKIDEFVYGK